jgi:cation-transporting ATPase I
MADRAASARDAPGPAVGDADEATEEDASPLGALVSGLRRTSAEGLHRLVDTMEKVDVRHRSVEAHDGRAHIEVRGVHLPGRQQLADGIETALARLPHVRWAKVNAALGVVSIVVDRDEEAPGLDELIAVVKEVEEAHDVAKEPFALALAPHPCDRGPILAETVKLLADLGGIGLASLTRAFHVPALAIEVANLYPALESLPPIRRLLREHPRLSLDAAVLNALVHGFAQGPLGLLNDSIRRSLTLGELAARRQAWLRLEKHLGEGPVPERVEALDAGERPRPLPPSAYERAAQAAAVGALGVGAATLLATRDVRRAGDVVLSGVPRTGWSGIEAFATGIDFQLAQRDALVMDARALRHLDRVDTVVLAGDAAASGRATLGEPTLVGGLDAAAADEALALLFDPLAVRTARADGELRLSPATDRQLRWPEGGRAEARRLARDGRLVLALARNGAVVALAPVRPDLAPGARRLVRAAREAGLEVLVATRDRALAHEVRVSHSVAGGPALARTVRHLQADGHVVAVVSRHGRAGLRAADLGLGVGRDRPLPWGAAVLCPGLEEAATVLHAVRLAKVAMRRTISVSLAGSGLAVLALNTTTRSPRRAADVVNVAGFAAAATGLATAAQLPRRAPPRPEPPPWHALGAEAVLAHLTASPAGLSSSVATERRTAARRRQVPAVLRSLGDELANPLTVLLGAGAGASAATGSVSDAVLIASVLGLGTAAGAFQRVRTDAAIRRLAREAADRTMHALRDGERTSVLASALVPGDIVLLEAGDAVRVDCRLLDSAQLEADESSLTGESLPVHKAVAPVGVRARLPERRSMVYAGTSIAAGSGRAVVVATGEDVEARRGVEESASPPPTGVEVRLSALTRATVPPVLAAGGVLALNSMLRGGETSEAVGAGVSLSAAAVPEGLPFVATIAETAAARRLSRRGVIVRNPSVLEALGRVDVLCFDKTGTLTEGHLELRSVSDGARRVSIDAVAGPAAEVLAAALRATPRPRGRRLPHPTDQAIVDGAGLVGIGVALGFPGWHLRRALPFEPARAYHAALGEREGARLLSVKGAPEVILARCRRWRRAGRAVRLDRRGRGALERELNELARQGLRVLAVAERQDVGPELDDAAVDALDFVGYVACGDPAREAAAEPIGHLLDTAQIVMITGDHPSTAEAIAAELGFLNSRRVVSGAELDALDDEELDAIVAEVAVFARTTPADKVRIVQSFARTGRVVAMTGDGANDAQAIRLADVGIAFGPRATAAAREVADLVVVNDSLETLIDAISEGRAMWTSVREALGLLLGGNLGEAGFATAAALASGRSPLSPRQILAVNLFTDLVPAMAIAAQPPPPGRRGAGPDESLGSSLTRDVAVRAGATALGAGTAWVAASLTGTPTRARTVALAALVGGQLGQTLVAGRRSWLTVTSTTVSAAGLVAIIELPVLNTFFECRPLGPGGWAIALGASALATGAGIVATHMLGHPSRPGCGESDGRRPGMESGDGGAHRAK